MLRLLCAVLSLLLGCDSRPVQLRNEWISTVQMRQFPSSRFPCQKIAVWSRAVINATGTGLKYYLSNSTTDCSLQTGFLVAISEDTATNITYVNVDCDGAVCGEEDMYISLMGPNGKDANDCFEQRKCNNGVLAFTAEQPIIVRFLSPEEREIRIEQ